MGTFDILMFQRAAWVFGWSPSSCRVIFETEKEMKAELPAVPDTARYVRALTDLEEDISVLDRELLFAHWSFPKHAATASELADATGVKNYRAVNLRYGRLGVRLRRELDFPVTQKREIPSYVISWFTRRDGNGDWELHMHPQMAAALKQLGWVKAATGLQAAAGG
jgi:putative restriction endonuclease